MQAFVFTDSRSLFKASMKHTKTRNYYITVWNNKEFFSFWFFGGCLGSVPWVCWSFDRLLSISKNEAMILIQHVISRTGNLKIPLKGCPLR